MQETQAPSAIENETLFLRLDLPSTLIRHENAAHQSGRIRTRRFFVFVWIENILKTELFVSLPKITAFLNSSA